MKMINKAMANNRSILKSLVKEGLNPLQKCDLEYCGFSFRALTGIEQLDEGKYKLYCYDYFLMPMKNGFRIEEDTSLYKINDESA